MGGGNTYSLEEQIVGKWIDGKPVYQKTIHFGALPNNASKSVAHNLGAFDRLIEITGTGQNFNPVEIMSLPFVHQQTIDDYNTRVVVGSTDITISCDQDRSMFDAYLTFKYTKTTD